MTIIKCVLCANTGQSLILEPQSQTELTVQRNSVFFWFSVDLCPLVIKQSDRSRFVRQAAAVDSVLLVTMTTSFSLTLTSTKPHTSSEPNLIRQPGPSSGCQSRRDNLQTCRTGCWECFKEKNVTFSEPVALIQPVRSRMHSNTQGSKPFLSPGCRREGTHCLLILACVCV